jgi:hypothetical protein
MIIGKIFEDTSDSEHWRDLQQARCESQFVKASWGKKFEWGEQFTTVKINS